MKIDTGFSILPARWIGRLLRSLSQSSQALAQRFDPAHPAIQELESCVDNGTTTVRDANDRLRAEIACRQQVEAALSRSEDLFRSIVENASDLIATLSLDGKFLYASPTFTTIMGYEIAELIGEPWAAIIHPDNLPELERLAARSIETGEDVTTEPYFAKHQDGSWRWHFSTASCVQDRDGNPLYLVAIARDITAYKQAQDAADTANRVKSEFLANISHELRTPLNGILGYAQLLKRQHSQALKQDSGQSRLQLTHGLDVIQRCGEHLLTLIDDILDLSKIEARKMELHPIEFHFPSFLKNITDIFQIRAEQKGISFIYQSPNHLPTGVYFDEQKLRQVLMNLIGNAIKFTDVGGVVFKVEVKSQDSLNKSHSIHFQVEDTGSGIPEQELQQIFLPFYQAPSHHLVEGTGLGLSISQKLVNMMGGELIVKSVLDQGSTFGFELDIPEVTSWQQPDRAKVANGGAQNKFAVDQTVDRQEVENFAFLPRTEIMAKLLQLSMIGDVKGILEQAAQLEQFDAKLSPFAIQIKQLAYSFQVKQLHEFIKRYI